ncbi:OmpH family outer membrane protein [Ectothiorhodospiraceae bacterium BW-2]|nr:OmpH family outer membrane protein [Ectothiorhodospiraceae bacterium BW-2]
MKMNQAIGSIAVVVWLTVTGTAFGAEPTRVAFVNTPELAERSPQAKEAIFKLEQEFSGRKNELEKRFNRIKELDNRLIRDGAIMSLSEKDSLEQELRRLQRDFKRDRDAFEEDFLLRQKEELAKMQREIAAVVIEVAKEQGFDLVLEAGVVYASPKADITDRVIQALQKASPQP